MHTKGLENTNAVSVVKTWPGILHIGFPCFFFFLPGLWTETTLQPLWGPSLWNVAAWVAGGGTSCVSMECCLRISQQTAFPGSFQNTVSCGMRVA